MKNEPSYPKVDSASLNAFSTVAKEYSQLVEHHSEMERGAFLTAMHAILPRLYAAGLQLPSTDILFPDDDSGDDDVDWSQPTRDPDRRAAEEWRQLYASLAGLIGERTRYRKAYPYDPDTEPEVGGSLADDFADIYSDIQSGLRKWLRGDTGDALWEWRFLFEHHWGEHLTGALSALYSLAADELQWPISDDPAA